MTEARNLITGEVLPEVLRTGYESAPNCDPQWIWVAEEAGKPIAILVAAPAHVVVLLVRVIAAPNAPAEALPVLMAKASDDCIARGYRGYMIWVNPFRPAEARLMKLIVATGGVQIEEPQVACIGRSDGGSLRDLDMAAVVAGLEAKEDELRWDS